MSMPYFVYKITNIKNNKIYIGKTNDLEKRWYHHIYNALIKNEATYFYNSIRKYGALNFKIETIEECDSEVLALDKEKYWIAILNCRDRKIGYNMTDGGDGVSGLIHTEKSKNKQRQKMRGRILTEEHKVKISIGNMGKTQTEEAKQKISTANKGENNGMFGKTPLKESKQKMSEFQSNRVRKPLTEDHKNALKKACKNQDHSFRIPIEIKNEIVQLYASGNYTKRQLAEKFNLKYNSVVKIIRSHKITIENRES